MGIYTIWNGPAVTTAPLPPVTTGTSTKTLLQLKGFNKYKILEWGISFDGSAAATPIKVELLDTGTVFATVTAFADADIGLLSDDGAAVPSIAGLTLGAAASGYTASAEGTITATDIYDYQLIAPTNQYVKQFPLGFEPRPLIGESVRIRVTAPAAVNAICYVIIEI